jgi:hypothetical protein
MTTRREFTQGSVFALIMALMASVTTEDDEQSEEQEVSRIPREYLDRYEAFWSDTSWMTQEGPEGTVWGSGIDWNALVMVRDRLLPGDDIFSRPGMSIGLAIHSLEHAIMMLCPHDPAEYIYVEGEWHDGYKDGDRVRCPHCKCSTIPHYAKGYREALGWEEGSLAA